MDAPNTTAPICIAIIARAPPLSILQTYYSTASRKSQYLILKIPLSPYASITPVCSLYGPCISQ